jgi:hypothetical protein
MTKIINVRLFEARTASDYVRITKVLKQWNGQNDLETLRNLCSFAEDKKGVDVQTIIEQFTDSIAPVMEQPFFHKKPSEPAQEQTLPTVEPSVPIREESLRDRLFKAVLDREGTPNFTGQNLKELNDGFHQLVNENLFPDSFEEQVEFLWQCI